MELSQWRWDTFVCGWSYFLQLPSFSGTWIHSSLKMKPEYMLWGRGCGASPKSLLFSMAICFLPRPNAKTLVSEQKDRGYLASRMSRFSSCCSEPVACSCTQKLAALACFPNTCHPLVPTSDCLWETAGGGGWPPYKYKFPGSIPWDSGPIGLPGIQESECRRGTFGGRSAGPGKAWSLCSLTSVLDFQSRNRNLGIV